MPTKSIYKSDRVDITLDDDKKIIRAAWNGFLKMNDLLDAVEHLLKSVEEHGIELHVSDQSELKVLTPDLKQYLQVDALKNMEEAGLKKVGVIQAENVFAKAAVDGVNKKAVVKNLTIQVFNNEKDCLNWLAP